MKPVVVDKSVLSSRDEFLSGVSGDLFLAARSHPAVFASKVLGMKLYGWQFLVADAVSRGEKRVIMNTSRQVGKSTLMAVLSLWFSLFNKGCTGEFRNTKVGVISATDGQAKKLLLDVKNLIRVGDLHCKEAYGEKSPLMSKGNFLSSLIDTSREAENTKSCVTFFPWEKRFGIFLEGSRIGSFIKSLPPTDIVRGETFDVLIVDEGAKIDDEIYYMAISKTGDKYDSVRLIASTPFGHSGFFYDLFDPEDKYGETSGWTRFWFTIEAIKLDEPLEYERRLKDINHELAMGKYLVVRQEYYGEFVQSEQSFFSPKKVDEMIDADSSVVESFSGECDLGVDFGGFKVSRTVLTISAVIDDKIRRLYTKRYGVKEDAALLEDITELKTRFNIQRIIVDDCPEGDFMTRLMEEKGWQITRMTFASEKVKKYGEFRSKLNKGEIKSYVDPELVAEMKSMQQVEGVQRTMIRHAPGMTDDLTDSFLMSTYHMLSEDTDFNFYDMNEYES